MLFCSVCVCVFVIVCGCVCYGSLSVLFAGALRDQRLLGQEPRHTANRPAQLCAEQQGECMMIVVVVVVVFVVRWLSYVMCYGVVGVVAVCVVFCVESSGTRTATHCKPACSIACRAER